MTYIRVPLPKPKPKIIIICGAEKGGTVQANRTNHPEAHIYAIEPEQASFEILCEKFKRDGKVTLINKAVWTEDGVKKLYIASSSAVHSFYVKDYGDMRSDKFQEVETLDFAKFLETFDHVDIIRMNMEGAEYEVLKHCFEKGSLDRVGILEVSLHARKIKDVQPMHEEVKKKLEEWGKTHVLKELK